jgi:hypothetical protein
LTTKVHKWYNLVIFTASVQEYADPVIDWLEQERKLFSGRYYRQHCTFRQGAFIKDLSSVEADLSKVMILDNSPMSYLFHEGMLLLFSPTHIIFFPSQQSHIVAQPLFSLSSPLGQCYTNRNCFRIYRQCHPHTRLDK